MVITKALLKYGYSVFSLEILEYCEALEAISREQYYLDLLKPEYNVLKIAGSSLGYKHPEGSQTRNWTSERKSKRLEWLTAAVLRTAAP